MWKQIAEQVAVRTGDDLEPFHPTPAGSGSVGRSYVVRAPSRRYFVKVAGPGTLSMYEAEAAALVQIAQATASLLRVPQPICSGETGEGAYLVLEWLDLGGAGDWERLGAGLAQLHRTTSTRGFGWERDNTIGATPQPNPWTADWGEFFARHRIAHQLGLAGPAIDREAAHRLLGRIPDILEAHFPAPALLHGDLWSGNSDFTRDGEPSIFDPATYYGDREADLAMTELFGGFPESFYRGYHRAWSPQPGYDRRKVLYNLYHVLNHYNLFGGSYASQANRMIRQLLVPFH